MLAGFRVWLAGPEALMIGTKVSFWGGWEWNSLDRKRSW
jgi:hypothetical protein